MSTFRAGLLTLVLLVGSAGQLRGLTGMKGMRGTFRTVSGDTEARGGLAFNLWFDYWRRAPDSTRQQEMNLSMAVSSSPRPSLELYGVVGLRMSENPMGLTPGSYSGLTDAELGVKVVRVTDSWLRPGLNLSLLLPTGKDEFSTDGTGFGALASVTFDFKNFESFLPLRAHLNGGYEHPGGGVSYRFPVRASLELPSRYFTPVVEFSSEQNPGDTLKFSESPMRFTQGLKATPFRWLSLSLGYDINLSHETNRQVKADAFDWRIFIGMTAARSLSGLGPQPGIVYGMIKDRETGEPIHARVSVRGRDLVTESDPETGLYSIEAVGEGLLSLIVEAEGYKKRIVPAVVVKGKRTERGIDLVPAVKHGLVRVAAEDRITGLPLEAICRMTGREVKEIETDSTGSSETVEIQSGEYEAVCSAPGYLTAVHTVQVLPDREEEILFSLLEHGEALVVEGAGFVSSSANLKIRSDAGVREVVELVRNNPDVRFEIGGHTDSAEQDPALSLKRASVFARFLTKGYGIKEERLLTKGYGADSPIADNSTEEGREKNRRIEIRALGGGD